MILLRVVITVTITQLRREKMWKQKKIGEG